MRVTDTRGEVSSVMNDRSSILWGVFNEGDRSIFPASCAFPDCRARESGARRLQEPAHLSFNSAGFPESRACYAGCDFCADLCEVNVLHCALKPYFAANPPRLLKISQNRGSQCASVWKGAIYPRGISLNGKKLVVNGRSMRYKGILRKLYWRCSMHVR